MVLLGPGHHYVVLDKSLDYISRNVTFVFALTYSCCATAPLLNHQRGSDYVVGPSCLEASLLKGWSSKSRLVNWVMALSRVTRAESSKIPIQNREVCH